MSRKKWPKKYSDHDIKCVFVTQVFRHENVIRAEILMELTDGETPRKHIREETKESKVS